MATKDAYYFSHDANARNDIKIIRLRRSLGLEGYGIYFCLIEMLREQNDYRLPLANIPDIAFDINTSEEKVKAVILSFDLFTTENDAFFSARLLRSMDEYNSKKLKLSNAGKEGNAKRWGSDRVAIGTGSEPDRIKGKKRKEKERKDSPPPREKKPQTPKLKISSCSADAAAFVAWWVEKVGPEGVNPSENEKIQWQNEYIDLVDIDGKTKEQIVRAATFGRTDNFWRSQFMTPLKLRKKNPEGIKYVDVFLENLRSGDSTGKPTQQKITRVLKQD